MVVIGSNVFGGLMSINFNSGKERDRLSRSFSQGCPTLPYRCYPLQKHFRRKVTEIKKILAWPIHQLRNTQKSRKGTPWYRTCYNKNQEM